MKKSSSLVCQSQVFVGAVFPPCFRQPSTIFGLSSLQWNLKVLQTQCAENYAEELFYVESLQHNKI